MACESSADKWDNVTEFNKSALDGISEHLDDLKSRGIEPSTLGKVGGNFNNIYDVIKAGNAAYNGNIKGSAVIASGAFFGAVGAAAGFVVAGFILPGIGLTGAVVVAGQIVVSGTGAAVLGNLGERIADWMFDPTLEPKFHEELLRNREQRLREKGLYAVLCGKRRSHFAEAGVNG
jgi:hypothetical protein